ncbi:MAG: hypothetical protein RLZZ598_490 [Pseudomonadota bacterium]|jgi:uncharacterized protein
MTISMHSASVPIYLKMLSNLSVWLDKAEAHATARKFDPAVYLQLRLAPDMLPFVTQIQIACDTAKFGISRVAGIEAPKFDDKEASLAELKQRIAATADFIRQVPAAQIDGRETATVMLPRRNREPVPFEGESYLKHFALPNFFFHLTMAYAILRHNGVELGKADFLGS